MKKPTKPILQPLPKMVLTYYSGYCDGPSSLKLAIEKLLTFFGVNPIESNADVYFEGEIEGSIRFEYPNPDYQKELERYENRDEIYAQELKQYENELEKYQKFILLEKKEKLQKQLDELNRELENK